MKLDHVIRLLSKTTLYPNVDIDYTAHLDDGRVVMVSIFWHSPSINLGWYPIVQIDVDNKTVYHNEGYESRTMDEAFVRSIIERLQRI